MLAAETKADRRGFRSTAELSEQSKYCFHIQYFGVACERRANGMKSLARFALRDRPQAAACLVFGVVRGASTTW